MLSISLLFDPRGVQIKGVTTFLKPEDSEIPGHIKGIMFLVVTTAVFGNQIDPQPTGLLVAISGKCTHLNQSLWAEGL